MAILETLIREHVKFDPKNSEHRKAYVMLNYHGRQHPKLRFVLEVPHLSVLFMMQESMALAFCNEEYESFRDLGQSFKSAEATVDLHVIRRRRDQAVLAT